MGSSASRPSSQATSPKNSLSQQTHRGGGGGPELSQNSNLARQLFVVPEVEEEEAFAIPPPYHEVAKGSAHGKQQSSQPTAPVADQETIESPTSTRARLLFHTNATIDLADLTLLAVGDCDALLQQYAAQVFARMDRDRSGELTLAEFEVLVRSPTLNLPANALDAEALFTSAALSFPGQLSFTEFQPVMCELLLLSSASALARMSSHAADGNASPVRESTRSFDVFEQVLAPGSRSTSRGRAAGRTLMACSTPIPTVSEVEQQLVSSSWQWFCVHLEVPGALPAYYNTVHDAMTYDKPVAFVETASETQAFTQVFVPSIGKVLTTCTDEASGRLLVLDWEGGQWVEMPDDWAAEATPVADGQGWMYEQPDSDTEIVRDSMERFVHPGTGVEYEAILENGKRLYFDDDTNAWQPIPVGLELHVPAVAAALAKMRGRIPTHASIVEQVLALRLHKYEVHATIGWYNCEIDPQLYTFVPSAVVSGAARAGAINNKSDSSELGKDADTLAVPISTCNDSKQGPSESSGLGTRSSSGQASCSRPSSASAASAAAATEAAAVVGAITALSATRPSSGRPPASRPTSARLSSVAPLTSSTETGTAASEIIKAADARSRPSSAVSTAAVRVSSAGGMQHMFAESFAAFQTANQALVVAEIQRAHTAGQTLVGESILELQRSNQALVEEFQRRAATAEASIRRCESDAAEANLESAMLRQRLHGLEQQLREVTTRDGESAALVSSLEEKIAALMQEIALLNEGGNWKTIAEERAVTVTTLSARVGRVTATADTLKRSVASCIEAAQFELSQVRKKLDTVRAQINEEITATVPVLLETMAAALLERTRAEVAEQTRDLTNKYRYEVRQRKLLYNKLQELKGNIRVFCRVRRDDRVRCVLRFPDAKGPGTPCEIQCPGSGSGEEAEAGRVFEFDRVYSPDSTQEEVFEDTEPIITSCVDGYNVCIIAYGQTGSGKTFTMMGPPDNEGVNRRAVRELIKICNERGSNASFAIRISLLEIYNERILDLLTAPHTDAIREIRLDPVSKLPFVDGRTERDVTTVDQVMQALADADENRHVASTKMNSSSSRSHLLLQLTVTSVDAITRQTSTGKLTLVDLAGSERIAKTEATGQRLVEAAAINKSLTALGQVFTALRMRQSHVPFRNSKLTHLLQDSLGGDAKTCVFVNTSPAESNLPETTGTLKFGAAIRTIELDPATKAKKKAA